MTQLIFKLFIAILCIIGSSSVNAESVTYSDTVTLLSGLEWEAVNEYVDLGVGDQVVLYLPQFDSQLGDLIDAELNIEYVGQTEFHMAATNEAFFYQLEWWINLPEELSLIPVYDWVGANYPGIENLTETKTTTGYFYDTYGHGSLIGTGSLEFLIVDYLVANGPIYGMATGYVDGTVEVEIEITYNYTPVPATITIDNLDTECAIVGTWNTRSTNPNSYGPDFRFTNNSSGTRTATFTPAFTAGAEYLVEVYYITHTNRATNVPIDIVHQGSTSFVTEDMTPAGGNSTGWHALGVYEFDAGNPSNNFVRIRTDGIDGNAIVDAVRFTPQ